MNKHIFVIKNKGLSEEDYHVWQKLSSNVLNTARMMGLSESKLTRHIFQSALNDLTTFEVAHKLSFLSLEMTLDEINRQKAFCSTP